ncbi:MAG: CDP-alcohol phosphatidyltransferase family protein [Patescibacteria group bacterium]|nr:CDP-alcohol phosphatidyltransferase family protein [Patescibacteria group bacterium]
MKWVINMRKLTDGWLINLSWPRINPSFISALAVGAAFGFAVFYKQNIIWLAVVFLVINLLGDWFDGIIAKKYGLASRKGWIIDIVADRLSEGIIFLYYPVPWFGFFILNCLLSIVSYWRRFAFILPIRLVFLVYFLIINFN